MGKQGSKNGIVLEAPLAENAVEGQPTHVKKTLGTSLLQTSLFLQLCLLLVIAFLSLTFYPGRFDAADAVQPELRHYVSKVATFLSSEQKPDIVILGSSLMLYPATLCDLQMEGKKPVDNNWYAAIFMPEYTHARYFEEQLKKDDNLDVSITNLAVASSLMSDHSSLLSALVAKGEAPRLVICGIAPRDFIDNNQPDLTKTPVHTLLADIRPELIASAAPQSIEAYIKTRFLPVQRATSCLRQALNRDFCGLANRPDNDNAAKMVPGVLELPESKAKDLDVYRKVYTPMKTERLAEQATYLEKMLRDARAHNIKVLLVNMPITADNASLLPDESLSLCNKTIAGIAVANQTKLLDLQRSSEFAPTDFIDSCHLNARGGAKFYRLLAQAVQSLNLPRASHQSP